LGPFGPNEAKNRTHDFYHNSLGPDDGAGKGVFLLSRNTETLYTQVSRKILAKAKRDHFSSVVNEFGQNQINGQVITKQLPRLQLENIILLPVRKRA
jgi:hypothetical protein